VGTKRVVDILLFKLKTLFHCEFGVFGIGWWYDRGRWARNECFCKVLLLLRHRGLSRFGIYVRVLQLRRLKLWLVSSH